MEVEKHHQKNNFFVKWFLNNRFSIVLLNILLFFLIIWVFNQISFVLIPFGHFLMQFCHQFWLHQSNIT